MRESADVLRDTSQAEPRFPGWFHCSGNFCFSLTSILLKNITYFCLLPFCVVFFSLFFFLNCICYNAVLHSPQPPPHTLPSSKLCFLTSLDLLSSKSLFLNSSHLLTCIFHSVFHITPFPQSSPTQWLANSILILASEAPVRLTQLHYTNGIGQYLLEQVPPSPELLKDMRGAISLLLEQIVFSSLESCSDHFNNVLCQGRIRPTEHQSKSKDFNMAELGKLHFSHPGLLTNIWTE